MGRWLEERDRIPFRERPSDSWLRLFSLDLLRSDVRRFWFMIALTRLARMPIATDVCERSKGTRQLVQSTARTLLRSFFSTADTKTLMASFGVLSL